MGGVGEVFESAQFNNEQNQAESENRPDEGPPLNGEAAGIPAVS